MPQNKKGTLSVSLAQMKMLPNDLPQLRCLIVNPVAQENGYG
jgi:hypothetical protein